MSHTVYLNGDMTFRPAYLKIAEIRELLPDIPILALTATATPEVVTDIQTKLKL